MVSRKDDPSKPNLLPPRSRGLAGPCGRDRTLNDQCREEHGAVPATIPGNGVTELTAAKRPFAGRDKLLRNSSQ